MSTPAAPISLPTGSANDLGDEAVVELIVRGFVDHCLSVFQTVAEGGRSLDDGIDDIGAQADTLNALFLGFSPIDAVITRPWNAPDQLGAYLRDAMGLDQPPEEAVKAALVHLATLTMRTVQDSPENWQGGVEALRLDMRELLLGRQPLGDVTASDDDALPM